MKWIVSLKEKKKAAVALFVVLAVILLNMFFNSKDYDKLDRNMSSIYNDRLMPAGYLFQISDHLYQKQLLHMDERIPATDLKQQLQQHDLSIAKLVKAYEATYLTAAEKQHWNKLLQSMAAYQLAEDKEVELQTKVMEASFINAQLALNQLNTIQATEGSLLQRSSKAIISETVLHTYLEITMIIVLAVIVLSLLAGRENPFFPIEQKHILN
ncbi:MCP four helix bundle domain-containing protein [Lacibacter sp. H407]|uniref:MCP four helix bundle domain-containing protein n=1 Tax=Lacibacter sp. H407 TaxID=3133423 RepID=UPI0030BD6C8F